MLFLRFSSAAPAAMLLSSISICSVQCQQTVFPDPSGQAYQHLLQIADLESKATEPFLIKLDYQLYDLDGNPAAKGTVEKAWGQTDSPHTVIKSSTLEMDESVPEDKLIPLHNRESYLVHQALSAVIHPLPYSNRRFDFILRRSQQAIENVAMNCLSVEHASKEPPGVALYCSDDNGHLQTITGEGPVVIQRSNFQKYRDKQVPADISISYRGKLAITAHVTQLDALTPVDAATVTAPSGGRLLLDHDGDLEALTTSGNNLTSSSLTRAAGLVVLSAIVTQSGTVTGLDVVSSASPILSKSAIDAAKKWTYAPYKFKGLPVDASTTITVDFNLNGP
jgi:TonB family protein